MLNHTKYIKKSKNIFKKLQKNWKKLQNLIVGKAEVKNRIEWAFPSITLLLSAIQFLQVFVFFKMSFDEWYVYFR